MRHQVSKSFVPEASILKAAGASAGELIDAAKSTKEQESAWVTRNQKRPAKHALRRPRKRQRKTSALLLCDDAMVQGAGVGLQHFEQRPRIFDRGPWHTWPLLTLASDLGAENVAACCFLQRHKHYNIELMGDPAHGIWNDAKNWH